MKNILAPLGLSAAMSATDAAINKKIHGYGTKKAKSSNKDLHNIVKMVKALQDSDVLMKRIIETLKNDIKKLLGTLGGSLLAGRGMYTAANQRQGLFRAGQKIISTFSSFNKL